MQQGKLIVFEGTDGSGKRTQMDLLTRNLTALAIPFETLDFPRYEESFFGKLAGRMMKGEFGGSRAISPELAVLPYACDRWLTKSDLIRWLSEGKLVISNRYTASSAVYHAAKLPSDKQQQFIHWVYELEQTVIGLPKEDIVLFCYMPAALSARLVNKKDTRAYLGNKAKDIYEEDSIMQKTVEALYRDLAGRSSGWKTINCIRGDTIKTTEEIHKDIVDVLAQSGVF